MDIFHRVIPELSPTLREPDKAIRGSVNGDPFRTLKRKTSVKFLNFTLSCLIIAYTEKQEFFFVIYYQWKILIITFVKKADSSDVKSSSKISIMIRPEPTPVWFFSTILFPDFI